MIANTFFQHPKRLLYTWKSPGDIYRNQIDYVLVRKRYRNCVKQCKTYPGADIGSDHNPLITSVSVRLKRAFPKVQKKETIDWGKLQNPEMKEKYLVDVRNKYELLSLETGEQETATSEQEQKWQRLKESIHHANEAAPKLEKKAKKIWMTEEILEKMNERKKAKNTPAYETKNREVQKMCKKEKDKWYNDKCEEIEKYMNLNGTKKMHNSIKELVGNSKSSTTTGCIKDKQGNMIFERDKVLERWAEYIGDLFADTRPSLPTPSNDRGPPIIHNEGRG